MGRVGASEYLLYVGALRVRFGGVFRGYLASWYGLGCCLLVVWSGIKGCDYVYGNLRE